MDNIHIQDDLLEYERRHLAMLRTGLASCTVLLQTDGSFPLEEPEKLALYGSGARHTVKGGTGSGEVNGRFFTTVEQGLRYARFQITTDAWLDAYDAERIKAEKVFRQRMRQEAKSHRQQVMVYAMGRIMPEPEYQIPLDGEGDTAIYVLSRNSGEGCDRETVPGDILLTETEQRDILTLNERYRRFMLVLNVGCPVDLSPVREVKNILLLGQLGTETGAVLADILLGKAYPSGKLTTTWSRWEDYAHLGGECCQDDTEYREGIYIGYRFFDTVGRKPLYPFGHGLSFTSFSCRTDSVSLKNSAVRICTTVTNTGIHPGREVVQVYLSAPAGSLDKPYQELAAFAKTRELSPGEAECLTLCFDLRDHASYNEQNECYVLEKGDYILRIGTSSAETVPAAVLRLGNDQIVLWAAKVCGEPGFADWRPELPQTYPVPADIPVFDVGDFGPAPVVSEPEYTVDPAVQTLTDEELCKLSVGAFDPKAGLASIIGTASLSVPGAAGETCDVLGKFGCSPLVMADGPAGLRLSKNYYRDEKGFHVLGSTMPESIAAYLPAPVRWLLGRPPKLKPGTKVEHQYATAIPIGTSIAQSWDTAFAEICGDVVGGEMERFGVRLWLAPALNIHRNIRCGRNFEYYSEDPVVSGKFAAAMTRGVQRHPACGVTIKHYAANNQETNRYNSNSLVSERALRELYLRGFGICIRESAPAALMTSYNLVNGTHTSQHKGLLVDILRHEYGFEGVVMTDWVTGGSVLSKNAKYAVPNAGQVAACGGDLFMPGCQKDLDEVKEELKSGRLTREQLLINATRILRLGRKGVNK